MALQSRWTSARAALAAALLGSIGLSIPPTVEAAQTGNSAQSSPAAPQALSPEENYLMTTYGITKDEADGRLDREEQATRLADTLRADSPNEYAGMWIDQQSGGSVVVAVTDTAAGRARGRDVADLVAQVVNGRHSLAELENDLRTLDGDLIRARGSRPAQADLFESAVDVQNNALHVRLWRGSNLVELARSLSGSSRLGGADVLLELSDDLLSPAVVTSCDDQSCDVARGGVKIRATTTNGVISCTSGFNVTRTISGHVHYMIMTAGHCGGRYNGGATFTWKQERPIPSVSPATLGPDYHFVFGVDSSNDFNDWGVLDITTPATWKPENNVLIEAFGVTTRNITSVQPYGGALVETVLCKTGMVTGTYCGTLKYYNSGPDVVVNNAVVHTHAMGRVDSVETCQGDSGGPWYAGNRAVGIISAIATTHAEHHCSNDFTRQCSSNADCGGCFVRNPSVLECLRWHRLLFLGTRVRKHPSA